MRFGPGIAVLVAGLVSPLALPLQARGGSADPRPNVLVIMTDDQRATGTLTRMPATRAWFREGGVSYPNGSTPIPVCCPARVSMMTGQYPHNHGVRRNTKGPSGLAALDQQTTLQRYLHDAGWRTGIFGKYLNGWSLDRDTPHFDDWAIFNKGYYGAKFNVRGHIRNVSRYSTDFIAEKALRFLLESEASDDVPWLMYVTPYSPHWPATPEPEYEEAAVGSWNGNPAFFEKTRGDKPPYIQVRNLEPLDQARRRRARQLRSLMSVDDLVTSLRRRLGDLDESRDTLAFFVSDNGMLWGEHGWTNKNVPYSASVSIPFFMRWPGGGVPKGVRDDRLASLVDVAPTSLAAAAVSPDHPLDGRSLLDPSWTRPQGLMEFWQRQAAGANAVPTWASIRSADHQYVEYYDQLGSVTFREYYDLADDPWQLINLLGDGKTGNDPPPDIQAELASQLSDARTCRGTTGEKACP